MRKLMMLLTALFVAVMLLPSVAKAEDTRQVITEVNLTMDQLAPKCNEPVANPTITVPTNAVYKLGNNCGWKWKNENGVFVGTEYATVFIPGVWKYELQVRIDGENASQWRFPDKKDNLTVKVNGAKWILVGDPNVYDAYSWATVRSPEYTITDEGVALNFHNPNTSYGNVKVPQSFKGIPIKEIRVCDYAYGGTKPYVFSKASGPSWITVAPNGFISGTPDTIGTNETLILRITDAVGAIKDVEVFVGETTCDPKDREIVTEIVGSVGSLQVYAGDPAENPTFSLPEGAHYRFPDSMGRWQRKKDDGKWVQLSEHELFAEGTYRCYTQVRIDNNNGKYYRFPSKDETPDRPTAKINGVTWEVGNTTVEDTYSYVNIYSPEIQVISVTRLSEVHLQGDLPTITPGEPLPAVNSIAVRAEDASKYGITNVYWERNSDGARFYNGGETVTPNDTYYLCIYFYPKTGCIF